LLARPEKIYRAFLEPDAMARWPVGFRGEHLELVPGERLRCADVFDDPNLPGR
jgi:uncharacterized protein YndB with AHSA1/START domain